MGGVGNVARLVLAAGSRDTVIWNDRADGQFISRTLNVKTGQKRELPMPVYSVSPKGQWAIAPDFSRLHDLRPGYGYAGLPDPHQSEKTPAKIGIRRMNTKSGKVDLPISIE